MSVLIKDFEMPKNCAECQFSDVFAYPPDYDDEWICELNYLSMNWEDAQMRHSNCPLVELPTPHGRLVDADALAADLKRQCKEVFKTDAVSPDDFWITRNQAYNERLWTTWCESLFDYLKAAPTIISAEEGGT